MNRDTGDWHCVNGDLNKVENIDAPAIRVYQVMGMNYSVKVCLPLLLRV
jgi:hypothetical protein